LDTWVRNAGKSQYSLLFRASRDGFAVGTFHQKCDDQGATVCVIRSESNHVFGGYTETSWKHAGAWVRDDKAWIYLLRSAKGDRPEQWIPIKNPECAIYTNNSYGPTFGAGHDLVIYDQCNTNTNSYSNLGRSHHMVIMLLKPDSLVLAISR